MNFKELKSNKIDSWGIQYIAKFDNGYGASIVQHSFSYGNERGLWELAVTMYSKPDEPEEYELCYTTPITDDVIGYLTEAEVNEILEEIKSLKPHKYVNTMPEVSPN